MNFSDLVGKTLTKVVGAAGDERITLTDSDNKSYCMFHSQDCCESVRVEDICGDLSDLIGSPLLRAEEVSSQEDPEDYKPDSDYRESYTWTFYKLATIKGSVTIRFLGESNGYYSESVEFAEC